LNTVFSTYMLYVFLLISFCLHLINIKIDLISFKVLLTYSFVIFIPSMYLSAYFEKLRAVYLFWVFNFIGIFGISFFLTGCFIYVVHIGRG
jgi:hypothetical protein